MAVTPEELEAEIAPLKKYYPSNTKIYMTGSNPFSVSASRIMEWIKVLRIYFPDFSELSMQTRIDDISHKSDQELSKLKEAGLAHLYMGTENGNDEALRLMNKGHDSKDTLAQLKRLDQAGIAYTCFYILGMAGKGKGVESGIATARMFNQVTPRRITTTGLTIFDNTELGEMIAKCELIPASEREKIEELQNFLNNLKINTFYDGIHYLNPLNYRFQTGDDFAKNSVLKEIDNILTEYSDAELELMVNRKQMKSL